MAHSSSVFTGKGAKGKQPPSRGGFKLRRRARRVLWWSAALIAVGAAGIGGRTAVREG
jgi:hypothetical protein